MKSGACGTYGKQERCIKILIRRPEVKRKLGIRRGRWEDSLEYVEVGGRIILKWILKKWDGEAWTGLIWLRVGTGGGYL
jgi:hypothetical protein